MSDFVPFVTSCVLNAGVLLKASLDAALQQIWGGETAIVQQFRPVFPWDAESEKHGVSFRAFESWYSSDQGWIMRRRNRALVRKLAADFAQQSGDDTLVPAASSAAPSMADYVSRLYYLPSGVRDGLSA